MTPDDLPDDYIPKELREQFTESREIAYGIGLTGGSMMHGPFKTLGEALDTVPDCGITKPHLYRFNKDGTDDVLFHWMGRYWKKAKK